MSSPAPVTASGYTTREVATLLGLAPASLRSFVRTGLVGAARGEAGEHRFSFQDLVLLRTAKGLLAAGIPQRRVERALAGLAERLPGERGLSGLRITARGREIVVRDGGREWEAESGQAVLDFEVAEVAVLAAARPVERPAAKPIADVATADAAEWFAAACELEPGDPAAAVAAYERTLALDPLHADAHLNLGRLRHEAGDPVAAERHYRAALAARPGDTTAAFDLGVALEDQGRLADAADAYETAIAADPAHADAHYNLALVRERLGDRAAALRHLKDYRRLVRS